MALINCPECNSQVSDKAKVCIKCGFPLEDYLNSKEIITDTTQATEKEKAKYWCRKCYRQNKIGEDYCSFCGERLTPLYEKEKLSINDPSSSIVNNEQQQLKKMRAEQRKASYEKFSSAVHDLAEALQGDTTARCPKCKSTSIAYDTKKLSIGRAVVGNAIAGAPGAILGGLSSKKGYAVCLNCGKRWKV